MERTAGIFKKSFIIFCLLALELGSISQAAVIENFNWDQENRVAIRGDNIKKCAILLAPLETTTVKKSTETVLQRIKNFNPYREAPYVLEDVQKVNKSMGIKLANTNKIEDFREALQKIILESGKATLKGSYLYITGVAMGKESELQAQYNEVLKELKLDKSEITIKILSITKSKASRDIKKVLNSFFNNVKYFFPSLTRDYESPTWQEFVSGLVTTALVEIPNVVYVYSKLPPLDANLVIATHTAVLGALTVYKKFLINWLLRSQNNVELYIKQASISLPFIANYNIFGNFSEIIKFTQAHTWTETVARFPTELSTFALTQGFTAFLQTLFYSVVITKGIRAWENSQVGSRKYEIARSAANWISAPVQAIDAVALTMASATGTILLSYGPMVLNTGHLALMGLTVAGSVLIVRPHLLDPTIKWYESIANFGRNLFGKKSKVNLTENSDEKNK